MSNSAGRQYGALPVLRADFDPGDVRLTGADLSRAGLRGADLTGADLRGMDLTGADLTRADLTSAVGLTPRQLINARVHQTTVLPGKSSSAGPVAVAITD